ncbi:MAG: MBOAT family O-acyltransferase [Elainellaceae cyanobacterium]
MIFSSLPFVFIFLPVAVAGFYILGRWPQLALAWLVLVSLVFYGYWNPSYVALILTSIGVNYALGWSCQRLASPSSPVPGSPTPNSPAPSKPAPSKPTSKQTAAGARHLMRLGVLINLAALGYFKYANFFVDNLNALAGSDLVLRQIILPLGISFFTFQQIAYLVDVSTGKIRDANFLRYCLFVTFFPQLIAGPIVHHAEMMPQFEQRRLFRPSARSLALGITLFAIGAFKKTVLADSLALYANPVFDVSLGNQPLTAGLAWVGALAYSFQLYFDFSGYADMSIGIGLLFNIRLPLNFFSPYKSTDIIEFWRRWHMTLSRFLRDYIYIPLGGSRHGLPRRYLNLMTTMLLGGLWHGAGWTFVIWGALHGSYLVVNHGWRSACQRRRSQPKSPQLKAAAKAAALAVTFAAVVVSWVVFRAGTVAAAGRMLSAMAGLQGFSADLSPLALNPWLNGVFAGAIVLAFFAPNAYELLSRYRPALQTYPVEDLLASSKLRWIPTSGWAVVSGILFSLAVLGMSRVSEFLYFQF